MQWYLLFTKPNEDARAQYHLLNQGYDVFRPLLRHYRIVKGGQRTVVESLFPRYIFIQLDQESSNWSRLRSTRGLTSIVSFNQQPAIVPHEFIDCLKLRIGTDSVLDQTCEQDCIFKTGEKVEICEGSFHGLRAIVKAQTSDERVIVLLNILGSQQAVSVLMRMLRPAQ